MRNALFVCAIILMGGIPADCFANKEVADKETKEAPRQEKDEAKRLRRKLDALLNFRRKTKLNVAQTLTYNQYREIAEPKLIDIFRRQQSLSQDDRIKARRELEIAKAQIQDDLDVILFGFQDPPDQGIAEVAAGNNPFPAGDNLVPAADTPLPDVPGNINDQPNYGGPQGNNHSGNGNAPPPTSNNNNSKRQHLRELEHSDKIAATNLKEWEKPIKNLQKQLDRVLNAEENGFGDPAELARRENSIHRLLETIECGQANKEQELKHLRQEEKALAAELGVSLPSGTQTDRSTNANSTEKVDSANRKPESSHRKETNVAVDKGAKHSSAWGQFGVEGGALW